MILWQIEVGGDRNFGYLIGDIDHREAAIIDPSYMYKRCLEMAAKPGLKITYVIGTHGHNDHTKGMAEIRKRTGAKSVRHKSTRGKPDIRVFHDDELQVGELTLRVIHTPGHTPDSMCILVEDKLITGDTLFVGKVGGTRTRNMAKKEFDSLHRLMALDDSIEVYPGHDFGVSPTSTIGHERKTNPFLLREDFEEFVYLKDNWETYKDAMAKDPRTDILVI